MNRIKYIDMLKVVAIIAVISLHAFGIGKDIDVLHLEIVHFGVLVKFGVPLFLMVTGALTLNKEINLKIFFQKKIIRIIYPLIFFLIIAIVTNVYSNPLESYWYCWMIISTYFAMPILNKIIYNSSFDELNYWIILILFTSTLYTVLNNFTIRTHLDFNFFIGPVAYLILGYYLSNKEFNLNSNIIIYLSVLGFVLSTIYKYYFGYALFLNYPFMISYLDVSIIQVIQTVSVFLFIKYVYESTSGIFIKLRRLFENNHINKCVESISRSTYGIYLLHIILFRAYIFPYCQNIPMTGTQAVIAIILTSVLLLLSSWAIIVILGKIPILKKFSGYA